MIKRTVEIASRGLFLSVRDDQLVIKGECGELSRIPIEDIGVMLLSTTAATYTHSVITRLLNAGAVIVACDESHLPCGLLLPQDNSLQAQRLGEQVAASKPLLKRLWRQIVIAKITNQAALLDHDFPAFKFLLALRAEVRSGDPTNVEAQAAKRYWAALFAEDEHVAQPPPAVIPPPLPLGEGWGEGDAVPPLPLGEGRVAAGDSPWRGEGDAVPPLPLGEGWGEGAPRGPTHDIPPDTPAPTNPHPLPLSQGERGKSAFRRGRDGPPPNNLLNYGYMALRASVARAIAGAGLHPTLGLHHHNRSDSFALADDLMEPLRPLVDQRVRKLWRAGKLTLDGEAKRELLGALTATVQVGDLTGPLMVALERMVASLVRCYAGEADKLEIPKLLIGESAEPMSEAAEPAIGEHKPEPELAPAGGTGN